VPQSLTIGKLTVSINIANSIDGKIILALTSPDGTTVLLSNQEGGTGTSFTGTVFDDQASTPIGSGQAPYTGTFQPETPLSAFNGKNAQGTWRLLVVDHGTNYHVTMTGWSLTFTPAGGGSQVRASSVVEGGAAVGDALAALGRSVTGGAPAVNGLAGTLPTILAAFGGRDSGGVSAAPQPTDAASRQSAADELFASADGIDRLAEMRVMMPHANTYEADSNDGGADAEADSEDAATLAFLDF
jgi:subtilisin-like proprotein convertase family protein